MDAHEQERLPYRTPTGNRVVAGIQTLIAIIALATAYAFGADATWDLTTILASLGLIIFGGISAYLLATGGSMNDVATKGVPRPVLSRLLGFIAAAMFAGLFIATIVVASADTWTRSNILVSGLCAFLFIYNLANASIANAQVFRMRSLGR